MTAVAGSALQAHGFTTPNNHMRAADGKQILGCFVNVGLIAGSYVSTDDCSIAGVGAAIAAQRRDGRPVTLLQACFGAPGVEAGTPFGCKTVAVVGDAITCELTAADMTTERANGAMGTIDRALVLWVIFKH